MLVCCWLQPTGRGHSLALDGCGRGGSRHRLWGLDIDDEALARYIVDDMRLLMVGEVRILNKRVIAEKHKRLKE